MTDIDTDLRLVKPGMILWNMQVGRELWRVRGIPGPFDMDQLAAVRIDEEEPDTEWDEMFRPMEPA